MSAAAAPSRALSVRSMDEVATATPEIKTNHIPVEPATEQSLQEQLQQLAYSLWEQRGCPEGSPETDWTEAIRQLGSTEAVVPERGAMAKAAGA